MWCDKELEEKRKLRYYMLDHVVIDANGLIY
jgi:hypothetical protein